MPRSPRSKPLTGAVLRRWPLPVPAGGDKDDRGTLLAIGGAEQMPGAIALTATAGLRAGAGKLQIATAFAVTAHVGVLVPEALVMRFEDAVEAAECADAVVVGPGMADGAGSAALVRRLLVKCRKGLLIDAAALAHVSAAKPGKLRTTPVLTPHAGEMAALMDCSKETVSADSERFALEAAQRFGAIVALKGAQTYVASPDGDLYCNRAGTVGLATSGSGDTLSGIIGGLMARGLDPLPAACWGVYAHAKAGEALMRRTGIGFLARELPGQIPGILRRLGAGRNANR